MELEFFKTLQIRRFLVESVTLDRVSAALKPRASRVDAVTHAFRRRLDVGCV
jgi:hypothetical protein